MLHKAVLLPEFGRNHAGQQLAHTSSPFAAAHLAGRQEQEQADARTRTRAADAAAASAANGGDGIPS